MENGQGQATVSLFRERVSESRSKTQVPSPLWGDLRERKTMSHYCYKIFGPCSHNTWLWNELRCEFANYQRFKNSGTFFSKRPWTAVVLKVLVYFVVVRCLFIFDGYLLFCFFTCRLLDTRAVESYPRAVVYIDTGQGWYWFEKSFSITSSWCFVRCKYIHVKCANLIIVWQNILIDVIKSPFIWVNQLLVALNTS